MKKKIQNRNSKVLFRVILGMSLVALFCIPQGYSAQTGRKIMPMDPNLRGPDTIAFEEPIMEESALMATPQAAVAPSLSMEAAAAPAAISAPHGGSPENALLIINHWRVFDDFFPDQAWVTSRIKDTERTRNVIAHTNELPAEEGARLEMHLRDWIKQVG